MSGCVIEPSLVGMPPELLFSMIPDPWTAHPELANINETWCDFGWAAEPGTFSPETQQWRQTLSVLRALSHTCRHLRAFSLPLLWKVVHVRSLKGLGKLRDALRLMPHPAESVRYFSFAWNQDILKWQPYPAAHGSALDMAFIDRGALWDRTREACGAELRRWDSNSYFLNDGQRYTQPGIPLASEDDSNRPRINVRRAGPDGAGDDPRVKSTDDFNECCSEIVGQLSSLRSFGWECNVTPTPAGVFEALKGARQLKHLHTRFWSPRKYQHLPLWELASGLEFLSIGDVFNEGRWNRRNNLDAASRDAPPVTEEQLFAFDVPSDPCRATHDNCLPTAWRTIATAAKGMQLKRLSIANMHRDALWKPFAVPALLPAWAGIEGWDSQDDGRLCWDMDYALEDGTTKMWLVAAARLRFMLFRMSHVVLARRGPSYHASSPRLLECSDVQLMHCEILENGLPTIINPAGKDTSQLPRRNRNTQLVPQCPTDGYLVWLRDDAELAQRVADAWNAVVERGGADLIQCYCPKCCKSNSLDHSSSLLLK